MVNNNSQNTKQGSDPALIEKFMKIQENELEMRAEELILRRQNDNNTYEYAKAALEANLKDRAAERSHAVVVIRNRYVFASVVIFCLVILFSIGLFLNKDPIVIEIIRAIIYFGAGGLGGYAFGKKNKDNS